MKLSDEERAAFRFILEHCGIHPDSPKGKLIQRNMEDFPEMTWAEHIQDAEKLLEEASGRKNYRLHTLKQDRAMRSGIKKRLGTKRSTRKSQGGPS